MASSTVAPDYFANTLTSNVEDYLANNIYHPINMWMWNVLQA